MELNILTLANFELESKDDIIGCNFVVYGSSAVTKTEVWSFFSLWDKDGRKIDEFIEHVDSFSEESNIYLGKQSYIVITPIIENEGIRITWYQISVHRTSVPLLATAISLVVLAPLLRKVKKKG